MRFNLLIIISVSLAGIGCTAISDTPSGTNSSDAGWGDANDAAQTDCVDLDLAEVADTTEDLDASPDDSIELGLEDATEKDGEAQDLPEEDSNKPAFSQAFVGTRNNAVESGSWWGENITKIAHKGTKTYTYVLDESSGSRKAYFYAKTSGQTWQAGKSLTVSRPPNLVVDSSGHVHIIGFEPFDSSQNEHEGRIFHVKFSTAGSVGSSYAFEYLTSDYRGNPTLETYGTYYVGAAIGDDDTLLVVYNNSLQWNTPGTHSLGARIYSSATESWEYESVAVNMDSRYCYPYAFVTANAYHVIAIEDDYDEDYLSAGPSYSTHPYRFGSVKHFQRTRAGGSWQETTLIDLNGQRTKVEIADAKLKVNDFYVDSSGICHALLTYGELSDFFSSKAYHYWKPETEADWTIDPLMASAQATWIKIWEDVTQRFFFVIHNPFQQILLQPLETNSLYTVSNLNGQNKEVPFIAGKRSGTAPDSTLFMVLYPSSDPVRAQSIIVDVNGELMANDQFNPRQLNVTVNYTGAGLVDNAHQLYVALMIDSNYSRFYGGGRTAINGGTVTIKWLEDFQPYIITFFDTDGTNGHVNGLPTEWGAYSQNPLQLSPGETKYITLQFP